MNIIHIIEKIPGLHWHFLEKIALPYFTILYVIDAVCAYRLCRRFNEPVWTAFIPLYNWRTAFKYCWNLEAFYEHVVLEVLNLVLPVIAGWIKVPIITTIITVIDLAVLVMAIRHGIHIGCYLYESWGYPINYPLIFILDIPLILAAFGKNIYLGNTSALHH